MTDAEFVDELQGHIHAAEYRNLGVLRAVERFMLASYHPTYFFYAGQTALYTGMQFEELAEKMEVLQLPDIADTLRSIADKFKNGHLDSCFDKADRADMLDADIDLAWVTFGSAFSQGADVYGAFAEVARANLSKIVDGVVRKDSNGKVMKPDGWKPPDLYPFTYYPPQEG